MPSDPASSRFDRSGKIALGDITPSLARRSGFAGVVDLLKVAKHGRGERVYLIEFEYRDA